MAIKAEPVDTTVPPPARAALPSKLAPPTGKPKAKPVENTAPAKAKARKALWDFRKATAWPVYRWPIEKRAVEEKTRLHLPRNYMALAGEDVVTLWAGTDVYQAVHRHYLEMTKENVKEEGEEERQSKRRKTTAKSEPDALVHFGANYVAGDEVVARRYARNKF